MKIKKYVIIGWFLLLSSLFVIGGNVIVKDGGLNVADVFHVDGTSGIVSAPQQPSFCATLSTQQTNLPVGSFTTIAFDDELFDRGDDFDAGTYKFTAPLDGIYAFDVYVYAANMDTLSTQVYLDLMVSGLTHYISRLNPSQVYNADTSQTFSGSLIWDMDAGDTAYVRYWQYLGTSQTDIVQGKANTLFCGHLLV